jgi:hypothetical protein
LKHLRETFTDQEFAQMQEIKKLTGFNWHDCIIQSMLRYALTRRDYYAEEGKLKERDCWQKPLEALAKTQ